ncbi:hypothetical protein [Actinomadura rubrisoli]|uniref:Nuclear transport factor 2 family protein n=1 Tax=Actinomadura rubrisoli TaxID=2530368 RepID=A0A4R5B9F7_9ACTN|nr:hypothetical protein [Actinomadura rubrisoli]TDD81679.1 hypothetical protein E1298_23815 [Actinomadura rubrisoli]
MSATLGERFAQALAAKDRDALCALLGPEIDFRALTPGRAWEAATPAETVDDIILGRWFDPDNHIERLVQVTTARMSDREHLSYRLQVRTGTTHYLVEQQAYYATAGDRITWLRILCSGYRPCEKADQVQGVPDTNPTR